LNNFTHLHLHSQYSLLDGANHVGKVIKKASKLSMSALALTDHGNMFGAMEFFEKCKKEGIKPIIGCELYINPKSRHERLTVQNGGAGTFHLTVLVNNKIGYHNLCRLVSLSYTEGFYFKPRIDHEILEMYSEGLTVLSGCMSSEVSRLILANKYEEAKQRVVFYQRVFKENYFLEVQPHKTPEQIKINNTLLQFSKELGIGLTATNDCHYLDSDDGYAQEVLMCISTAKNINDPTRIKHHENVKLHLKTRQELEEEFNDKNYIEALDNSNLIADNCNFEFDTSKIYMPLFEPEDNLTLDEYFCKLSKDGLKKRLDAIREKRLIPGKELKEYEDRLEFELNLLVDMGFSGYFLVVADFINWAKENGIPVGPGRGSAAGSLVSYALKIINIDPIEHKLLFERFLNPERKSMPDIDIDFCINGRDRVIDYVKQKYGEDKVGQIITFGTLKAKAVIKDVGRVLGMSYAETDRIAQLIPAPRQGFDFDLTAAIKMESKLEAFSKGEGKDFINLAKKLEGLTRHTSTHAAGVVIGDRPLLELVPLMKDKDDNIVTQYSGKYIEKAGLIKFDFLGLKNLSTIQTAIELIKLNRGIDINIDDIPIDDKKTYQTLCDGNTTGIFQLESSGITDMTMKLKPEKFVDIVATIALYRPGPLDAGTVDDYINRKHGREKVKYTHSLMEDTLKDTYGIMVFQEQIMELARVLSGYSLGEADLLRRAMGKKVPAEMAAQRKRFLEGTKKSKIPDNKANKIFDTMETFARYGFNRSHAAAYAMITYQTAYLRTHFPTEFLAALLSHDLNDTDKVFKFISEAKKSNITIKPPCVNKSIGSFSVNGDTINYGLVAIKGIGEKAILGLVEERRNAGDYKSFEDFCLRVDYKFLNKKLLENLIKAGAFDSINNNRRQLFENYEHISKIAAKRQKQKDSSQISLFSNSSVVNKFPEMSKTPMWSENQMLTMEKESLGFYVSGHPITEYKEFLVKKNSKDILEAKQMQNKSEVKIGGVVTGLKLRNTKKGDRYASFIFEDDTGVIEALVWPDSYLKVSHLLETNEVLLAEGKLDITDQRAAFIISGITALAENKNSRVSFGLIDFEAEEVTDSQLELLKQIFEQHPGSTPVKIKLKLEAKEVIINLKDQYNNEVMVIPSEDLKDQVSQVFGKSVLNFI